MSKRSNLFSALLKYWRGQRGLSQLDLALDAEVSARHISFLETGRATPSREMVLRLALTLSLSYRQQNELLQGAGFENEYDEPNLQNEMPEVFRQAIERLKQHQEPFPLVVMNRLYDIVDMNVSAQEMAMTFAKDPSKFESFNAMRMLFDPNGFQPHIENFDDVGRDLLWRLQREAIANPGDEELGALVDDVFAYESVKKSWRRVDLSRSSDPALVLHLKRDELRMSFFTMMTAFNAPQNITVEELRIESYFAFDDATHNLCVERAAP